MKTVARKQFISQIPFSYKFCNELSILLCPSHMEELLYIGTLHHLRQLVLHHCSDKLTMIFNFEIIIILKNLLAIVVFFQNLLTLVTSTVVRCLFLFLDSFLICLAVRKMFWHITNERIFSSACLRCRDKDLTVITHRWY